MICVLLVLAIFLVAAKPNILQTFPCLYACKIDTPNRWAFCVGRRGLPPTFCSLCRELSLSASHISYFTSASSVGVLLLLFLLITTILLAFSAGSSSIACTSHAVGETN